MEFRPGRQAGCRPVWADKLLEGLERQAYGLYNNVVQILIFIYMKVSHYQMYRL